MGIRAEITTRTVVILGVMFHGAIGHLGENIIDWSGQGIAWIVTPAPQSIQVAAIDPDFPAISVDGAGISDLATASKRYSTAMELLGTLQLAREINGVLKAKTAAPASEGIKAFRELRSIQ